MRRRSEREPVDPAVQAARINRRGTLITAMATVIAALIGGLFAAYKVGSDQGAAAVPPRTVTVTTTVPGPGAPPASTGAAQASDVSTQVRLDSGTGVDIDAADPRAVETSGPNGDVDLSFADSGLMVGRSAMYYYNGGENAASAACPKAVANDKPAPGGPVVLFAGSQFCMRTSEGKVGWVSCNDVKVAGDHTGYIVLNYRLFATT
ncbi:hypothetical protein Q5425_28740 [Amycolatopsis sp. A133]|uniref:hypothetical protein n=1 Tax=Amycolatopsis sp. A133 TaxID=3064472 RepID=UPI0027E6981A|nr:hypothetical protein [Amycolatopsis sp. A133]MDQ7807741.1 hypothetical protein [Amycolatopsis sp. A133]